MNYKDMAVINERKLNQKVEKLQEQLYHEQDVSYIVFLLGTDNFKTSKEIRKIAEEFCNMSALYENCIYIANKFLEYDKEFYNTKSQYESLETFLIEYENQIIDYLYTHTEIEL